MMQISCKSVQIFRNPETILCQMMALLQNTWICLIFIQLYPVSINKSMIKQSRQQTLRAYRPKVYTVAPSDSVLTDRMCAHHSSWSPDKYDSEIWVILLLTRVLLSPQVNSGGLTRGYKFMRAGPFLGVKALVLKDQIF